MVAVQSMEHHKAMQSLILDCYIEIEKKSHKEEKMIAYKIVYTYSYYPENIHVKATVGDKWSQKAMLLRLFFLKNFRCPLVI